MDVRSACSGPKVVVKSTFLEVEGDASPPPRLNRASTDSTVYVHNAQAEDTKYEWQKLQDAFREADKLVPISEEPAPTLLTQRKSLGRLAALQEAARSKDTLARDVLVDIEDPLGAEAKSSKAAVPKDVSADLEHESVPEDTFREADQYVPISEEALSAVQPKRKTLNRLAAIQEAARSKAAEPRTTPADIADVAGVEDRAALGFDFDIHGLTEASPSQKLANGGGRKVFVKHGFLNVSDSPVDKDQPTTTRRASTFGGEVCHAAEKDDAQPQYVNDGVSWRKPQQRRKTTGDAEEEPRGVVEDRFGATGSSTQTGAVMQCNAFNESVQQFAAIQAAQAAHFAYLHAASLASPWLAMPVSVMPTIASASRPEASLPSGSTITAASGQQKPEAKRTTAMMRNVPNNYTRDMLIELLNVEGFGYQYNFVYLPTDYATGAGLGFAFVNLVSTTEAQRFQAHFDGFKRWAIPSSKVCSIGWSGPDQQGLKANIQRYRNSSVMHQSVPAERKPVIFVDGVNVPFPKSTKKVWPPHADYGIRSKKGQR